MHRGWRTRIAGGLALGCALSAPGQIDPTRRELIQLGYTQPLEGRSPLAAYAYYFLNQPDFLHHTNLTLRLAVAPVYLDSELGVAKPLGHRTDLGIGLAGGGYADSYSEVRQGDHLRSESFYGHGGEVSASLYHRFNPGGRIPLHGVVRGAWHGTVFADDDDTDPAFALPADQFLGRVRAGFRWGGREPVMMPELAFEVSAWYEGSFRLKPGLYGYDDRMLNPNSHLAWGRALFTYTLPQLKHNFGINITGGLGWNQDRFSCYRLGGNLPLYAEFPLTLPGYYFQELSASSFVLFGGSYAVPLDRRQLWRLGFTVSSAWTDYLPGFELPSSWNTGVSGALVFRSPSDSWQIAVASGYGIDAIRDHGWGSHSLSFLLQFDLGRTRQRFYDPSMDLNRTRGLQGIIKTIFN